MKKIILTMQVILDLDKYKSYGIDCPIEDIKARFERFADTMAQSMPEFEEVLSVKTKVEEVDV